ncbi:hypothetical protein LKE12_004350 [Salmonella enterica subsp. enterica serovar Amager]|nr:hypothetical protein [Salmonella enterica subsp. enterica serovar Amager]
MLSGIPGRSRDRLRSFLVFIQYSFPVLLKKWQHGTLSAAQGVFMRKYITDAEWYVFFNAITGSRTECRDKAMFKMVYQHGLRVSELTGKGWDEWNNLQREY